MSYSRGRLWYRFKAYHFEFLQTGAGFRQAHIEPTLGVFFRKSFTLDFGVSMWTGNDMSEEIKLRLALSFQLAFMALSLTILTAVPLGVVAAYYKGRWQDYIIQVFSITGVAIPSFWLGIMVLVGIFIITQKLTGSPWMPPIIFASPFENILNKL